MKKNGLLHPQLAKIVAQLGHGDQLMIADAGLPIPPSVERVDLAFAPSKPGFWEVLKVLRNDLVIEGIILAQEVSSKSPVLEAQILDEFKDVEIRYISHQQLKEQTKLVRAVVRTGEFTPYANLILVSGVSF